MAKFARSEFRFVVPRTGRLSLPLAARPQGGAAGGAPALGPRVTRPTAPRR